MSWYLTFYVYIGLKVFAFDRASHTNVLYARAPLDPALRQMPFLTPHYTRYKDGDLNVGENSCVDRCTSKYWQTTGIVGQLLGTGQA